MKALWKNESAPVRNTWRDCVRFETRVVCCSPDRTLPSIRQTLVRQASPAAWSIVDFATLEEAKDWANDDPYVAAGVYRKVTVKPFKQVLP